MVLGATKGEVYSLKRSNTTPGLGPIWKRYTIRELEDMADSLYRKCFRFHPDLHPEDRKYYDECFKNITRAYRKIKQILKHKKKV
jgi:hypothetical protein